MRVSQRFVRFALGSIAILLGAWSAAAKADTAINAVPSAWLIQRYVGGGILIFNAGSSCSQGTLAYTGSSSEEAAELWSLIISAKMANRMVLIWYDGTNSSCVIKSFGLLPN